MQGGHSPVVVSHVVLPSLRQDLTELQKALVSEAPTADAASAEAAAATAATRCSARRPMGIAPLFLCCRLSRPPLAETSGQTHRSS